MALIGRLHPLLIHFPIALVVVAVVSETAAVTTGDSRWRLVAIANLQAGAASAIGATLAGWRLAAAPGMGATSLLEWHRWLGTTGAAVTIVAALATVRLWRGSAFDLWRYRVALFGAGALVAIAAHLGGLLAWGADFLRP